MALAAPVQPQAADHPRRLLRNRPQGRRGAEHDRRHRRSSGRTGRRQQPDDRSRARLRGDVDRPRQRRPQLQHGHPGGVARDGEGAPRRAVRRAALHDRHRLLGRLADPAAGRQRLPRHLPGDPAAVLVPGRLVDRQPARRLPPDARLLRGPERSGLRASSGTRPRSPRSRATPTYVNSIILDSLYFTALGDPTNPCAGVTDEERYSASNPTGVRCTLADVMINVFGPRPSDGFAGRPLDNVGVQYGLEALKAGTISKQQFIDLNVKIGGADIDAAPTAGAHPGRPARSAQRATAAARSTTARTSTRSRSSTCAAPTTAPSTTPTAPSRSAPGSTASTAPTPTRSSGREPVPLLGGTDFTTKGLIAMDSWLAAVEKDGREGRRRPEDPRGQARPTSSTTASCPAASASPAPTARRSFASTRPRAWSPATRSPPTRTSASSSRSTRRDYGTTTFSDSELAELQAVFPDGVCDFSKPAVSSATPTLPWMNYSDVVGGRPLPGRKLTAGWASRAFRSVRGPKAAREAASAALSRR